MNVESERTEATAIDAEKNIFKKKGDEEEQRGFKKVVGEENGDPSHEGASLYRSRLVSIPLYRSPSTTLAGWGSECQARDGIICCRHCENKLAIKLGGPNHSSLLTEETHSKFSKPSLRGRGMAQIRPLCGLFCITSAFRGTQSQPQVSHQVFHSTAYSGPACAFDECHGRFT